MPEPATLLSLLPWLDSMILQAKGCYEAAAAAFQALLRERCPVTPAAPAPLRMSLTEVRAVVHGVSECFLALDDWEAMSEWLAQLQELRAYYDQTPFHPTLRRRSLTLLALPGIWVFCSFCFCLFLFGFVCFVLFSVFVSMIFCCVCFVCYLCFLFDVVCFFSFLMFCSDLLCGAGDGTSLLCGTLAWFAVCTHMIS